jgi:hypothetical protein
VIDDVRVSSSSNECRGVAYSAKRNIASGELGLDGTANGSHEWAGKFIILRGAHSPTDAHSLHLNFAMFSGRCWRHSKTLDLPIRRIARKWLSGTEKTLFWQEMKRDVCGRGGLLMYVFPLALRAHGTAYSTCAPYSDT